MSTLQIVIPLYNEIHTLPELWERLSAACTPLGMDWSVLFVDDGSSDGTADALDQLAGSHPNISVLHLSRNFGHQAALTAGIDHAEADAIVLMDGDLQDTPETLPRFVEAWKNGAEVAYAIRTKRKEGLFSRLAFKSFYRLLGLLSGISQPADAGIFSLLDRRVLQVVRAMPEHNRYFPGLRAFAGFRQVGLPVERGARFADEPRVGFKGLVKLASDAVFSFSYVPLRIVTWFGIFMATASFAYLVWVLCQKFITHAAISGWTSILGAVLLLGSIQIVMLGVVGEYIARIYEETKRRPPYVVGRRISAKD